MTEEDQGSGVSPEQENQQEQAPASEAEQQRQADAAFQEDAQQESRRQREKREKAEGIQRRAASKKKAAAKARAPRTTNKKEKTHVIKLHNNPEIPPSGQYFGVNGRWMMIKPNVEQEVPESVLEVLDNAVRHEAEKDEHNRVVGTREVPRFPYTFVRKPKRQNENV